MTLEAIQKNIIYQISGLFELSLLLHGVNSATELMGKSTNIDVDSTYSVTSMQWENTSPEYHKRMKEQSTIDP